MSKLRDRIRETDRRRRGGFGFAPASAEQSGGYVLVLAEVEDATAAAVAVEAGADALLYRGEVDGCAAVVEAAAGLPVGCRLEAATAEQTAAAAAAHADFFVFDDARASAEALLERGLGRVLLLRDAPDEERLRTLAPLDIDAILLAAPSSTPTVRDQLLLRRIVELAHAPLIMPAAGVVPTSTLEVWRDGGAPVVLVATEQAGDLAALVVAAREVRPPQRRSEERPDALVPSTAGAHDDDEDDEFDDGG